MISICVPTYNRLEFTIKCLEQILDCDVVSEIIISDDYSTDDSYERLIEFFKHSPKTKIYRNDANIDCYFNKKRAIELATSDWCCLWDSDNIFSPFYLDTIFDYSWDENTIYTPDFAMPNFDFRKYSGETISKENVRDFIDLPMFEVMCNAANFFVNRKSYLDVWDGSIDPVTSDSIYFAYKWLESGRNIFVVPGLQYIHTVHPKSHYQNNISRTPIGFHQSILNKLKQLY